MIPPQFTVNFPIIGNTWAVGVAFQVHLVLVAFIMGIAILAPVAELLGFRARSAHWARLAHELASTITRFFSFGATWAVLGLVLLFGLFPTLFGTLTSIFFWPLLVVGGIWFVMTVTAYLYYNTWERFSNQRGLHLSIGALFALAAFVFITLITELSSYQLTPTDPTSLLAAALNPSWLTEIIHRHIGNLSYAGLLLAGYAGFQMLFFNGQPEDRAYYDWLGNLGLLLGTALALLQPIVGWFYARQIQTASPYAYERMMIGDNAWMFLVQSFFFGVVLLLGNLYLSLAIERANPRSGAASWMRISVWIIALLVLLVIIPKEWPLGQMTPWKYIGLAGLVLLSLVNFVLYLRARRSFVWGNVGRNSQQSLVLLGVATVALLVTMGVIRESARGSDLIYQQLPSSQAQQLQQP